MRFNRLVKNLITKEVFSKWWMFLLRSFHFCKGSLQQGGSRLGSKTELFVSQKSVSHHQQLTLQKALPKAQCKLTEQGRGK